MDRYAIIPLQCNCGSSYEAPVRARPGRTRSGLNIVKCLDCGANLHIPGELAQPLVRKNQGPPAKASLSRLRHDPKGGADGFCSFQSTT